MTYFNPNRASSASNSLAVLDPTLLNRCNDPNKLVENLVQLTDNLLKLRELEFQQERQREQQEAEWINRSTERQNQLIHQILKQADQQGIDGESLPYLKAMTIDQLQDYITDRWPHLAA